MKCNKMEGEKICEEQGWKGEKRKEEMEEVGDEKREDSKRGRRRK